MKWRYQPVIIGPSDDAVVVLCEMHFDDAGKLELWSADPHEYASGTTLEELAQDICRMLIDAFSWTPVRFDSLKVGMEFSRAITMEQRNALADFTQKIAHNTNQARAEVPK